MEIGNTTLVNEINAVLNSGVKPVHFYWEAAILAGGKLHAPRNLVSIDIICDYAGAYADEMLLTVTIGGGTFSREIVPFKEDLKVILFKNPIGEVTDNLDVEGGSAQQEFRATLTEVPTETTQPATPQNQDVETGNLVSLRTVTLALQDASLEQLRTMTFGTTVRRTTPAQVLRAFVTQVSKSINVDLTNKIKGITMVPEHNTEARDHIVIPHGTPLFSLADYLQDKAGGIYGSGLGFYLRKDMWYVWPLYDLSRFDTTPKTVTFILLPANQFNSVERTFRTTANQLIVLITGGATHQDNSEQQLMNAGNGVRFTDSRRVIEGFGEVKDNRVVAKRSFNNSEFVGVERSTGLNNVAARGPTNNVYSETSRLAKGKGSLMTVHWQNSDPDLLRPDMPAQVIYLDGEMPKTLNASLLQAHTFISSPTNTLTDHRHTSSTAVTLFVDKDLPEFKDYEATTNPAQPTQSLAV